MDIKLNCLVLYKSNPARVTRTTGSEKLEIELHDGGSKSVRHKDIQLIHEGPITKLDLKKNLSPKEDILEICSLIEPSSVNLSELSELLYGKATPQTNWSAWELLNDNLYFKGTIDKIEAKSEHEINEIIAKRNAKAAAEEEKENLISRIKNFKIVPDDTKFMREIEQFALGKTPSCHLMDQLEIEQTQEKAHELLLRTGYWNNFVNPYPERFGISLKSSLGSDISKYHLADEERKDLTQFEAFAIDDEGCNDPDDALSFDGKFLYVHIADAASLVTPGSELDASAMNMAASLYLPERTLPMLPAGVNELFALGFSEISPALTFKLTLDSDNNSKLAEVFPSYVKVKRMTYVEAEELLDSGNFKSIYELTRQFYNKRMTEGAIELIFPESKIKVDGNKIEIKNIPQLKSRGLVEEAMLMTGQAVADFAIKNNIIIPFSTQSVDDDIIVSNNLAGMFNCRKKMRAALIQTSPERHSGLGLAHYTKATSPLRRYLDLLLHQQLRAFISNQPLMSEDEVSKKITFIQSFAREYRALESNSNRHWTIVYMDSRKWKGEAVLVNKYDNKGTFIIPELAYEFKLPIDREMELNSKIMISLNGINLPYLNCYFQVTI